MHRASMVSGHAVRSPSLVSVGGDGKWLAYGCAPDMMVVCALQDESTEQRSLREEEFIAAMRIVFLGAEEKLSVIVIHQTKELLCIGTAHDGLYLTTASNPTLSSTTTRLPIRVTGENVFSACFIDGYEKFSDVLVVSCGSQDLSKERFKLSLWDANARTLLWRGSADAQDAIVALPGIFGFASCTQREVTLWTVQPHGEVGLNANGQPSANGGREKTRNENGETTGFTVLSKKCSIVNELRDAEFVAIVPPRGVEDSLTVLTTVGFLVSFDCRNGVPVKWMDCKVCPATAAYRIADDIIVCGSLVRFFSSDKWEFHGKIKQNGPSTVVSSSLLTRLMDSLCTGAAVCGKDRAVFFFSGGDMSRYRVIRPMSGTSRLSFHQLYQYTPVLPDEGPLRWIPLTVDTLCLWSPQRLRLYDTKHWRNSNMTIESTCAVYHSSLGVLLVYDSSAYEIVAIMPNLERELCRLGVDEPLTSLAVHEEDQFVSVSLDSSLFYFKGQWKTKDEFILQGLQVTRLTGFKTPLTKLVSVAGAVCAASTHLVANLQTGKDVSIAEDIISFDVTGNMLLVVHRHSCVVLDPTTMQRVGEPLRVTALKEVVPSPNGDLVALRGEGTLSVISLKDRHLVAQLSLQRDASTLHSATIISVGFTADGDSLVTCESRGLVSVYRLSKLESTLETDVTRVPRLQSERGGVRRSLSCDVPTNNELQSRFQDLHGYYETTRRTRKEREKGQKKTNSTTFSSSRQNTTTTTSSSGVLILARGNSILQIPSGSADQKIPSLRGWENDGAATELPYVVSAIEAPDVAVTASMVELSALTSMDSALNFNLRTVAESEATLTPSITANLLENEREKVKFTDAPKYGVRSPARKGQPSISPIKTPEDDVVNIDSNENEELRQHLHQDPVALGGAPAKFPSVDSSSSSSVRVRSCEIRDALRDLAEAYEQQDKEGVVNGAENIDAETVEEMFNTLSRLYARLQSRQPRRPDSAGSIASSDISSASFNVILSDLERLRQQNSRIEAQNEEILSRLRKN
ncbi:hypothetical protein MOQ_002693 [Trypanosoma cruzi marinkellei]|uniref:Uncharacterized protein n=1 Tax=Trypanosoma cruzi marinkellei TaxID=85056 RepID=K2N632_TRYCR|nr:hypothetical protein MOQ_002693 [Trypanosoma cruzi marinkellei]